MLSTPEVNLLVLQVRQSHSWTERPPGFSENLIPSISMSIAVEYMAFHSTHLQFYVRFPSVRFRS